MTNKKILIKLFIIILIVFLGVAYYSSSNNNSQLLKQEHRSTEVGTGTSNEFIVEKNQSLKDFFLKSAPRGESVVSFFTNQKIEVQGKELFVVVYDTTDNEGNDEKNSVSGDDTSGYQPSVYAFIKKGNNKDVYTRALVAHLSVDGGVSTKVGDIFTENFSTTTENKQLALITVWDSSNAGGHSVMETSGLFYKILAFKLNTDLTFSPFENNVVSQLDDCECSTFIRDGTVHDGEIISKTTSHIKNVVDVKKEILRIKSSITTLLP